MTSDPYLTNMSFWCVEVQISFLDFVPEESTTEDKNFSSEVQIWFLEFVTKQ